MASTVVIQSHTQPLPADWIQTCLDSVKYWCAIKQFDYQFYDDALFDHISTDIKQKLAHQCIIATDLARLKILQKHLKEGYETVIWCDADFLIFSPEIFQLPHDNYALGRETWIQADKKSITKLISKVKVHNAFMMFRENNNFLDFYTETAERLIQRNTGNVPPQFIGPKLLTALHNIVQCPIAENAGMLSPLVIKDIASGGGAALDLYKEKSAHTSYAANLCASLFIKNSISVKEMEKCINILLNKPNLLN